MPETMSAWEQEGYGPASGVRRVERPIPAPGRGEVLLQVRATALNAGDVRIMLGDPLLVRPVFGIRRPRNPVRGMDVAGTVVALGEGVDGVDVDEEVVVELPGGGGLAQYAVAPAVRLARRPAAVAPHLAATLPIAAGTAWQALDASGVGDGQRVLILGASGGVGTFAVQLAALRGAQVDATCSARNRVVVEGLGAHVIDRDTRPARLPAESYDAVVEIASGAPLRDLRRLVRDGGSVVLVGGDGGRVLGPVPRMLRAALLSAGSNRRIRSLAATPRAEILTRLLDLVAVGRLHPLIEREYSFADVADALAHVEAGHTVGKVVVHVAG
ncbi:NAD(P)-dependent alcohol dehydrogenase [Microbacterium esteraromaticum]|uniref:NAD(P)-dependent alcohol dehydrogenase n=1 Tax=Microbacterium esteraromaticum TaxID=57043 RepID=UPI001959ABF2|nr:NAD(P)-dependent alcohol dehydrogenase [Microbacterium esteraromaticum]MBM7465653.1 NADPH:quinone reductase-like Zn-dependent oxidoreductase [Microbacterium esteraromaticum]